ncbi:hypothetical protein FWK35_00004045 [Aphis craccivora]|uniref:Uncharacterized protein n=1 Tax=Aphis craccivora TaxID=307492 RepID=A0A6G0Z5P4_APHCR|nr:hypothetical protein FWK35_00004045 [Aphis craccivora]
MNQNPILTGTLETDWTSLTYMSTLDQLENNKMARIRRLFDNFSTREKKSCKIKTQTYDKCSKSL